MTNKSDVSVEIIKSVDPRSKQAEENTKTAGTRSPELPFSTLVNLYYESFVVGGLTDKIATAIASGFETQDQELLKVLNKIDQEFLGRNKVLCWNAFFEVIRDWTDKVVDLLPILSDTIEIMEDGDGYRQQVGTDVVYFNAFTPKDDQKARQEIWEKSSAKDDELANTGDGCGFNPNLNEVYQFKNTSLRTKYYGASSYESCVDQLILIEQIDKYYSKGFDNGMIKAKMIFPKTEKKSFSTNDKKVLKEFIKSKMKGVNNSFSTAIVDVEVGQLDLEHEIDAKAFIEYRQELLKSVSIALNVPYDMLISDNSNKSTSQTSKETFNEFTIIPLQNQLIKDFKIIFGDDYKVDDLDYKFIDTKDEKEQMEVWTGYKKAGIVTANEVREKLGLPRIEGGDDLMTDNQSQMKDQINEILKKEASNFYNDLTKIEHDLYKDL